MQQIGPDNPRISIELQHADNATVVSIGGHITELEADELSSTLDKLFEEHNYNIVLDLANVAFLSSTGIGQIMRAFRITRENGGFVRLAQVQPLVADVFRVTKLDKLLGIYDTVEEALQAG